MKNVNKVVLIIAIIIVLGLIGCVSFGLIKKSTQQVQNPIVTMEVEEYGTVKIELYPEMAPNTVRNFIKLINEGYYDGLTFHKVKESLIQRWG